MRLTEQEKKDILSNYSNETSDELLTYLKRHFPTHELKVDFIDKPLKFIQIDDKQRPLYQNKKYLVSKIYSLVEEQWINLGTPVIRRTIKKYLDGVTNF